MRFRYSTIHFEHTEYDSLARVPLLLQNEDKQSTVLGVVDSGSTLNILPYSVEIELGAIWNPTRATLRLSGNLGGLLAYPLALTATIGEYPPARLLFAWVQNNDVPILLGQTNFFQEFEVRFYRWKMEFEVLPKSEE